jgi:hypothetical protein
MGGQIHIIHIDTDGAEPSQDKMKDILLNPGCSEKRISSYCPPT